MPPMPLDHSFLILYHLMDQASVTRWMAGHIGILHPLVFCVRIAVDNGIPEKEIFLTLVHFFAVKCPQILLE